MKHFAVVAGSGVPRILPLLAALAVSLFAGEGMAQEGFAERVVTLCQAAGRTPPNFGDTNNTKCATCHSNWQSPAKSNLNAKGLAFQGGNVLATFCPGAPVPPPTPAPTRFNLSVVRYGTGYVGSEPSAIDCGGQCVASLPAKSTVKLTASPGVGFNFSGWTGACSGTAGQCTVRMDGNKTVSAVFAAQGAASCGAATDAAAAEGLRATFERADARDLADREDLRSSFDLVICLCQGAFGLMQDPGQDRAVVAGLASVLRDGGTLVMSAFNAYFQVRHHVEADFEAATGVGHEWTTVRSPDGSDREVELWTGCYTPKELVLLAERYGLEPVATYGVEPGAYARRAPSIDLPEVLLVARRRGAAGSV